MPDIYMKLPLLLKGFFPVHGSFESLIKYVSEKYLVHYVIHNELRYNKDNWGHADEWIPYNALMTTSSSAWYAVRPQSH